MDTTLFGSLFLFVAILVLLVYLRVGRNKIEVKPGDIAAAALPVIVILMVQGKIKSFQFGDLKVEAAIREASETEIRKQVAPLLTLPVEHVEVSVKGSMLELGRLQKERPEGLTFVVGERRYVGSVIREYLRTLPSLRYLVLERPDHSLLAIADAAKTALALSGSESAMTADDLAKWLNTGDKALLEQLPGYVPGNAAVSQAADKEKVLRQMDEQNVDVLPAVDEGGRFAGVVSRGRLTASMLVDIAARLR